MDVLESTSLGAQAARLARCACRLPHYLASIPPSSWLETYSSRRRTVKAPVCPHTRPVSGGTKVSGGALVPADQPGWHRVPHRDGRPCPGRRSGCGSGLLTRGTPGGHGFTAAKEMRWLVSPTAGRLLQFEPTRSPLVVDFLLIGNRFPERHSGGLGQPSPSSESASPWRRVTDG
jgi:hypothetical protein